MLNVVDVTARELTDAATTLGAAKTRIDLQKSSTSILMDSIDRGVGQLVDADMNVESTRLQALQVQQQLGIQALSIANTNAQSISRCSRARSSQPRLWPVKSGRASTERGPISFSHKLRCLVWRKPFSRESHDQCLSRSRRIIANLQSFGPRRLGHDGGDRSAGRRHDRLGSYYLNRRPTRRFMSGSNAPT